MTDRSHHESKSKDEGGAGNPETKGKSGDPKTSLGLLIVASALIITITPKVMGVSFEGEQLNWVYTAMLWMFKAIFILSATPTVLLAIAAIWPGICNFRWSITCMTAAFLSGTGPFVLAELVVKATP